MSPRSVPCNGANQNATALLEQWNYSSLLSSDSLLRNSPTMTKLTKIHGYGTVYGVLHASPAAHHLTRENRLPSVCKHLPFKVNRVNRVRDGTVGTFRWFFAACQAAMRYACCSDRHEFAETAQAVRITQRKEFSETLAESCLYSLLGLHALTIFRRSYPPFV